MKTTVLLIDCDLGLVFWLGRALDESGCESFPAKSIPDGLRLIDELHLSIDVAVFNYDLPGAREFVTTMRRKQHAVKLIALVRDPDAALDPMVDWRITKPRDTDETSRTQLLDAIQQAFTREVSYHQGELLSAARSHRF